MTVCPKFGKSLCGIYRCMAPGGQCNEQHTDRFCEIKPTKKGAAA